MPDIWGNFSCGHLRMPEITPWARERIELDRVLVGNENGQ